jgi:hypothetical protein
MTPRLIDGSRRSWARLSLRASFENPC